MELEKKIKQPENAKNVLSTGMDRRNRQIQRAIDNAFVRQRKCRQNSPDSASEKSLTKQKQDRGSLIRIGTIDAPAVLTSASKISPLPKNVTIFTPLPRRKPISKPKLKSDAAPSMLTQPNFKASFFKVLGRFFVALYAAAYFYGGNFKDWLRRKNTVERRARRLRHSFEKAGGTFVKIGQQMAMRVDLLPWAYCVELSKMLDKMPPPKQHVKHAEQVIASTTKKTLEEIFVAFDPDPIGSASIACVYQAILKNGKEVAVKIRRPDIGEVFAADLTVIDWLLRLVEVLTLIRPGITKNFRYELTTTLLDELDFRQETRYQELFRVRSAKKHSGKSFFTAPRVYPDLSGEEVIVQEYVTGIWLSEVLTAIEGGDKQACEYLEQVNIDPKIIAKRLTWVNSWGMFDNLFFHADPHPANICVQPGNKLVFIDFGSCGSMSESHRLIMQQMADAESREDIEGMARGALMLLEPLPPIDLAEFSKRVETEYRNSVHAMKSKHAKWWERTSASLWLSFFKATREYQIPMSPDTLRMVRSGLLYETLVARLDHKFDKVRYFHKYLEFAGKKASLRLSKQQYGGARDYLRQEQAVHTMNNLLYHVQRTLMNPNYRFVSNVEKSISTIIYIGKLAISTAITAGFGGLAILAYLYFTDQQKFHTLHDGDDFFWAEILQQLKENDFFQAIILILLILALRRIQFRLKDKKVD